jgi:hypothetical protein
MARKKAMEEYKNNADNADNGGEDGEEYDEGTVRKKTGKAPKKK